MTSNIIIHRTRGKRGPIISSRPTEVVYLASPKRMHGTALLRRAAARVQRAFPEGRVIDGSEHFSGIEDWRARWPALATTLTALVVVADQEGWIGKGTLAEVQHALRQQLPVHYLTPDRTFWPWADVHGTTPREESWSRYVHLLVPDAAGVARDA